MGEQLARKENHVTTTASPLSTTLRRTDRWIVALSGEVDAASRPELISLAESLSKFEGDIDFDLSGVRFIDSAGWAGVQAASGAARTAGRSARIINPSPPVRHLTDAIARSHAQPGRARRSERGRGSGHVASRRRVPVSTPSRRPYAVV
jgi:anti-anti-sigma regulatory factor